MSFLRQALCAAVLCLPLWSSASKQSVPAWWTTQVTLKEEHADVRDALRAFFRQMNVNYSIAPEVQGTISCDIAGNAVEVLPRIRAAVHSHYRTESGVVQIVHDADPYATQPPPKPIMAQRVSISVPAEFHHVFTPTSFKLSNVTVQEALTELFTKVPRRYVLRSRPTVKITADLSHLPLDEALRIICAQANLSVTYVNDVFEFRAPRFVPPGIISTGGPWEGILNTPPKQHDWVSGG